MKVYAIPSIASGVTAAMSVLFYAGLSRVIGDGLLGHIILVQSAVAMVVIACVPQCWVYLIAAKNRDDLVVRYRRGFSIEIIGFALGAVVIAAALAIPGSKQWDGALVIFASLSVQASSSCIGWLRATESWGRYLLWVLGSNLIRVPLIWATPWLVVRHWLPDARDEQVMVIAIYFLVPDLMRWLGVAVPIALRHYRWPGLGETVVGARVILRNWFYDLGSALNDVGDKVVVGAFLGPQTLVAYFFARRLGIAATMVCEPFYAEQFRRTMKVSEPLARGHYQAVVFRQGLSLAFALFLAAMAAVSVAMLVPMFSDFVPAAVLALLPLFVLVLLIDCLLAGNRWSRFIAQINGGNARLLGLRMFLFGIFVFNVWLFGNSLAGLGLAVAIALSWLLEAGYVVTLLRAVRRPGRLSGDPLTNANEHA